MSPHRKANVKPATSPSKWIAESLLVILLSFSALLVALGGQYIFGHKIQPGQTAERDYVARQKQTVTDSVRTKQAQDIAREEMMPVFQRDASSEQKILKAAESKLSAVGELQHRHTADTIVDENERQLAAMLDEQSYPAWRDSVLKATGHFLRVVNVYPGTRTKDLEENVYQFMPEDLTPPVRQKTAELVTSVLQPDMMIDTESTRDRAKEITEKIKPITKQIDTGTLVIPKGHKLTQDDVNLLSEMGISHTTDIGNLLALGTALLAAFCLFALFLFTFEPQYFYSPSAVALMATVCVTTSGVASAVGREYPQFVPLPATAMVLSVIFGRRVAIALALLVILFFRVSDLIDPSHLVALAAASGMALGTNIRKRKELMLTGILIGMVQAIGYFAAVMFGGMPGSALGVGKELVQNLLGGLSSSIVAIGSLPFLEIIFGILTPFRVAELSEPDQPLLRQLEENAPGTYQHSLAVANLAEAGAKAIGADVNLVRAGAMYHDIGKMVTPRFFIENQLGDKNPHDEITPEESRAKVLAHVTNGLVLARKYGLPKQVQDFIPEHQGTTIMAYFYHKACVRDGADRVNELDYRYPGPKPQTKETAIVMLADVSEAVTHSMKDPSQEDVEKAIGNVFKARWDDGQFNESGLTPEELTKVEQAFVRVWRTLHHDRLKYPATTTGRMPVPPPISTTPQNN